MCSESMVQVNGETFRYCDLSQEAQRAVDQMEASSLCIEREQVALRFFERQLIKAIEAERSPILKASEC